MTQTEFINRAVGLPWASHRADWDAMNCYGLVILYFRHVMGIELGELPKTDIASGFASIQGWQECDDVSGSVGFMSWRDGAPTHCGIVLDGQKLLHSEGSELHPGNVRVSRMSAMRAIYGELRFYKYTC